MDQAVIATRVKGETRIRSQIIPCEVFRAQSGAGTGESFSPSASAFLLKRHSTNAPYSSPF
jgi:hypothetical protein